MIIGEPNLLRATPTPVDGRSADARSVSRDLERPIVTVTVEELYVRLAPELIRFATSLVGPSQAEDLLGSTVAKAIASTRWDRIDNKRAYLYRMLVNEAHNSRRTSRRRSDRELRVVHRDTVEMERGLDPDVLAALKL